jgi:hypothetical protein
VDDCTDRTSEHVDDVGGSFTFQQVAIAWSFEEDGGAAGSTEWVLEAKLADVGVTRRFPVNLTREEAEAEAKKIVPDLFRIAEAWVK